MIDNSKKFETFKEKMAYHEGWIDGMKNSDQVIDKIDRERRLIMIKEKYGKNK